MDGWATASSLDRCEAERADPGWVAAQWSLPLAQVLVVDERGRLACAADGGIDWRRPVGPFDPDRHLLLGALAGRPVFATAGPVDLGSGLRDLIPTLEAADREVVVAAVALVNWHRTSAFCGRCGSATTVRAGGTVRHCPSCDRDRFPRTDPAIIVAVLDRQDRLLLGHQVVWPRGRMSLLAGFVSAGESAEQAVHREVAEESGVRLSAVRYVGSQPWPFPRSLMLGFVARAADARIVVDEVEIDHARWFARDDLTVAVESGEVGLPGPSSIALGIIDQWRRGTLPVPEG